MEPHSETCIIVNFTRRIVLIAGTSYAGELKKSVFTILNHLLPARRRHAHALLGQHGPRWQSGAVLRLIRHRQNHAFRRPEALPDRRRRARLERPRRVQFRRRLLRQVHPALARTGAADLERHPLRHGARKRGHGSGDARARFQLGRDHGEHARGLSARVHRERRTAQRGRASQPHTFSDRGCIRRAAADLRGSRPSRPCIIF